MVRSGFNDNLKKKIFGWFTKVSYFVNFRIWAGFRLSIRIGDFDEFDGFDDFDDFDGFDDFDHFVLLDFWREKEVTIH